MQTILTKRYIQFKASEVGKYTHICDVEHVCLDTLHMYIVKYKHSCTQDKMGYYDHRCIQNRMRHYD